MAQGTSERRNIAPPPQPPRPKTPMDPTSTKRPNSTTTTTTSKQPHTRSQDPTFAPPSTIKNISNHFAKLYVNHKTRGSSLKGTNGISKSRQPPMDTNSEEKEAVSSSAASLDSSCITLTKSNSQHSRNLGHIRNDKNAPRGAHDEKALARENWKECKEKIFYEEKDVNKAATCLNLMMSKSVEFDDQIKNMNRGRRKSFSCSQNELVDFFSCNGVKVVAVDMPPFMQIHAVDCARKAHDSLEKFTSKSLALNLKKEFDGVYGPAWHCIVGTSFGSFVTHSVGGFMYFSLDKLYILLFKTTVRKAD